MSLTTVSTLPWLSTALADLPGFGDTDVSGVTVLPVDGVPILVAVSDEGRVVAFVPLDPDGPLSPLGFDLGDHVHGLGKREIDLEGVTHRDGVVYAAGSMSLKRPTISPALKRAEAVERLGDIRPASGRRRRHSDHVYALHPRVMNGALSVSFEGSTEVRTTLLSDPLLQPFAGVPSKDNGLDCEGIAWDGTHFWAGLRGPVLRGQALLVRLSKKLRKPVLYPLPLDGWGIRALTYGVTDTWGDGLYLVSGPTMTHPGPFALWRYRPWDTGPGGLTALGALDIEQTGAKVESVFLWDGQVRMLLDGPSGGSPFLVTCGARPVR